MVSMTTSILNKQTSRMKKYKHIFFDLDNTLWDFAANSKDSLKNIFDKYHFDKNFSSFESFYNIYEKLNSELWDQYRAGNISKETLSIRRFQFASDAKKNQEITPFILNADYLATTTLKTKTIDNAKEVLNYLKDKYNIHIITDGFFEVQMVKLRSSQLSSFISNVITAEEIGYLKPKKELFFFALESCDAIAEESIMVGDDYKNDILGAYNVGIDQIFFDKNNLSDLSIKPTFTIGSLKEIINIL